MPNELEGRTVALLIAPRGTEEPEFAQPREAVQSAGGTVEAISTEAGDVETVNSDLDPGGTYTADKAFSDADPTGYDALILPGGCVGADTLRGDEEAVAFVKRFFDAGKPVAAICHAPWLLIEADEASGRRLTSYPTLRTDLQNAGATWTDEQVVLDDVEGGSALVTSRTPDDLPAFCDTLVEVFAEAGQ